MKEGSHGAYARVTVLVGREPATAAQDRTDPGHQLARAVRLGHVVVGAEFEAEQYAVLGGASGQHQDGDVVVSAQCPAHLEAVDHRKHQIEDDEVGAVSPRFREGGSAVVNDGGRVSLPQQRATYQFRLLLVVLGDQHMCAHGADAMRIRPGTGR